ncbi:hypothetical protein BU17DRAFT_67018 [Hysterangium stoloniferum]|nr:hypothetical protein BU17DRAFT_67018 [Hysterangium stoloniferum]
MAPMWTTKEQDELLAHTYKNMSETCEGRDFSERWLAEAEDTKALETLFYQKKLKPLIDQKWVDHCLANPGKAGGEISFHRSAINNAWESESHEVKAEVEEAFKKDTPEQEIFDKFFNDVWWEINTQCAKWAQELGRPVLILASACDGSREAQPLSVFHLLNIKRNQLEWKKIYGQTEEIKAQRAAKKEEEKQKAVKKLAKSMMTKQANRQAKPTWRSAQGDSNNKNETVAGENTMCNESAADP